MYPSDILFKPIETKAKEIKPSHLVLVINNLGANLTGVEKCTQRLRTTAQEGDNYCTQRLRAAAQKRLIEQNLKINAPCNTTITYMHCFMQYYYHARHASQYYYYLRALYTQTLPGTQLIILYITIFATDRLSTVHC